jgi:hypothetical protein
MSILLGLRLHLSMDVDLYTFVDTCCLHYHQFWWIGLYVHLHLVTRYEAELQARGTKNTLPDSHLICLALGPAPIYRDIIASSLIELETPNITPPISTSAKIPLYLSAPPIHTPNSIISQSVILTPYTAQPVSNYVATPPIRHLGPQ